MKKNLYVLACALCTLLSLPAVAQVPAYVPADGLVGWWPFNGNANDESGNGNNGVVNGATLTEDRNGDANKSYYFNGISDFISVLHSGYFDLSNGMSLSLWFQSIANQDAVILEKFTPSNGPGDGGPQLALRSTEIADFNILHNNEDNIVYSNTSSFPSSWQHIVVTWDGSQIKLFQCAVMNNSLTFIQTLNPCLEPLTIGKRASLNDFYFFGKIDDIAIYNRALTEQEIQNLYTGTTPPPCTALPSNLQQGLVGYWPFCGNANDESGNGNDGTVNGATLTEDRFGNAESAYDFFGSGQYINLGDAGLAANPDTFSLSVWTLADSLYEGFYGETSVILSKRHTDNGPSWSTIQVDSLGRGTFAVDGPGYVNKIHNDTDITGAWSHILAVKQGPSYTLYVNGEFVASEVDFYSHLGSNMDMYVGHHGAWNTFFYGSIDDIGIWNRALTPEEVQELYTLEACTFTIYDTVYTYETIYDTVTTYVTVTDTLLIDITFTGFEGQPSWLNTVTVFPNPASDHITIDYGNFALMAGYNTIITNAAGATVYSSAVNSQQVDVDINAWGATGVYYMSIYDVNGALVAVRHIVLQ
jgi:hypothetical protein